MYVIKADDYVVHDGFVQDHDCAVVSGTFTEEFNRAGTLSFTVPPNNEAYRRGYLKKLITIIRVFDKRNKMIWKGRIIDTSKDFYGNVTFNCEGWMGVLNDSIIRPNGTSGGGDGGGTTTESVIDRAVEWAVAIANNSAHGYDQANRWGPDYDCSSLVISAWEAAGVPVKTNGATYTGDMYQVFTGLGFVDAKGQQLKRGDVLLNYARHTALVVGTNTTDGLLYIVEAAGNENGGSTGGTPGDQTGREILVRPYGDSIFGNGMALDAVLRYPVIEGATVTASGPVGTVATYNLTDDQIRGLANVFISEEGHAEAAIKAAASHLLNRFERYPINGLTDPYNYLIHAGWWGSVALNQGRINGSHGTANTSEIDWVSEVIRQGKRNIPLYIDEYDMFPGDIASATNNGVAINKSDRSQYIKDVTIVRNVYGSTYTFYGFPGNADIFGYINKRPGDVDFIPADSGSGNGWSGSSEYDTIRIDPASYFVWLIQNHNEQVGEDKALNVMMPSNIFATEIDFPAANYETTLDYIETNFLNNEEVGGRMWVEDNTIYYYPDGTEDTSTQPIVFGENLLDLTEAYDASEVFTAILPTGGEVEVSEGVKKTLTLGLYGGSDYIISDVGAKMYGIIVRHVDFGDITDINVLAEKAIEYLAKNIESSMTIEVSAFDMGLVDNTAGNIKVGTFVEVRSEPHGIHKAYICTASNIDITNPANSKYTLGVNSDTLTTRQMKLVRNISNTTGITVENPSYNIHYEAYTNRIEVQAMYFKRSGHSVQMQFRAKALVDVAANYGDYNLFTYDSRFSINAYTRFNTGNNETTKRSTQIYVSSSSNNFRIGIVVKSAITTGDIITGSATWIYDD